MILFDGKEEFTTSLKRALTEIDPNWRKYKGLIVPGSHTPTLIEEKIEAIKNARERKIPALLICLGHQLAAIEYARNILGIKDATSEEFGEGTFVVKKRKQGLKIGHKKDGTYWNNYEVTIETKHPWWFYSTQTHPEYESSIGNTHPLLVSFILACKSR